MFGSAGSWSFGNGFARNVVTFDVDYSSSSHADNCKNNFWLLVKDRLMILMTAFVCSRQNFA